MTMLGDVRPVFQREQPGEAETTENLRAFLQARFRNNLHLVLCMSPEHPKFAERARKFPGVIACCSIDWFLPWPQEALHSVAQGTLRAFLASAEVRCFARVDRRDSDCERFVCR